MKMIRINLGISGSVIGKRQTVRRLNLMLLLFTPKLQKDKRENKEKDSQKKMTQLYNWPVPFFFPPFFMPPLFIIIEFIKGIVKQSDTRSSWWDRAIVKHVLVESNKWSKNRKRKQTNSDLVSSWDFICVPTSKCRWFRLPKTTTLYFEWKKAFPSSKKKKKKELFHLVSQMYSTCLSTKQTF